MNKSDEVKLLPCDVTQKIAEIVHGAMVWAAQQMGQPKPWQNGNSYAEDRAREATRAIEATRPTDEVVERVARAIHDARFADVGADWMLPPTRDYSDQEYCLKLARAAIAAMKDAASD